VKTGAAGPGILLAVRVFLSRHKGNSLPVRKCQVDSRPPAELVSGVPLNALGRDCQGRGLLAVCHLELRHDVGRDATALVDIQALLPSPVAYLLVPGVVCAGPAALARPAEFPPGIPPPARMAWFSPAECVTRPPGCAPGVARQRRVFGLTMAAEVSAHFPARPFGPQRVFPGGGKAQAPRSGRKGFKAELDGLRERVRTLWPSPGLSCPAARVPLCPRAGPGTSGRDTAGPAAGSQRRSRRRLRVIRHDWGRVAKPRRLMVKVTMTVVAARGRGSPGPGSVLTGGHQPDAGQAVDAEPGESGGDLGQALQDDGAGRARHKGPPETACSPLAASSCAFPAKAA